MSEEAEGLPTAGAKMNQANGKAKPPRERPPLEGVFIAGMVWFWGSGLVFLPSYLGFDGLLRSGITTLGALFLLLSIVFATIEMGNILQQEALGYFGVGLLFALPAIALHAVLEATHPGATALAVFRTVAWVLFLMGGTAFLFGLPYLFWRKAKPEEQRQDPTERFNQRVKQAVSVIVTLLSAGTVIAGVLPKVFR